MQRTVKHTEHLTEAIHILTWIYIFISPLFFVNYGESIDWERYASRCILPFTLCVLFYANYLGLIPHLFQRGRFYEYFIYNAVLVLLLTLAHKFAVEGILPPPPRPRPNDPPHWWFTLNGVLVSLFTIGIAIALQMGKRWAKSEAARKEAELGRTAAELQNLRNQINPHFLLNTLNNIYALTAFDPDKAQHAIQELSKMLRYLLYENKGERVSLESEVGFLKNYIELMRIRIPARVEITTNFELRPDGIGQVAPLLFIPIVENAFKHGINPGATSFIRISLRSDAESICLNVTNSNHPAPSTDRSAGGIGIDLVKRRLELAYPGHYTWNYGPDTSGRTYQSELTIYPRNQRP